MLYFLSRFSGFSVVLFRFLNLSQSLKSLRRSLTVVLFFRQEMVEIKILLGCCIPRIIIKYRVALYQLQKQTGCWKSNGFLELRVERGQITQSRARKKAEMQGKETQERKKAFKSVFFQYDLDALQQSWLSYQDFWVFYNRTMESLHILCNVYNFLSVPLSTKQPISLQAIEQFRQINLLIHEFVTTDYLNPKSTFEELHQFINKEEEIFGPRKFKKMIESISIIIFQFLLEKLRKEQADVVILCLTYYQRYCNKYLTRPIKTAIAIIYSLTHLKKDNISISENYINQAKILAKNQEKDAENAEFFQSVKTLTCVMEGISFLKRGDLTKAKFIFNEVISQLTEKMHDEQTKRKKLSIQTISYFTIATFYQAQSYLKAGDYDKAAYHATHCKEFAQGYLPKSEHLVAYLQEGHTYALGMVKLGRIENKIERIKSLHFNGHHGKSNSKHFKENRNQFKITKRQGELKISNAKVKGELDNLLTLQEDNEARLKKKTLKELKGEQAEKQRKIQYFQQEIACFSKQKEEILTKYQNQKEIADITMKQAEKQLLQAQISQSIWPVVHTLKATKKIQAYLTCFKAMISYQTTNKFFKFLYNHVSFKSHLKLFSILRKLRSKLIKEVIRSIKINGVGHQVELLKHKVTGSHHLKVYQVDKGEGVNIEMEIGEQVYRSLQREEFCYTFQVEKRKVMLLSEYIKALPPSILSRIKLFCFKLKRAILQKRGELLIKKMQINLTFNSYYYQLKYKVLITSHKIKKGSYSHSIERIDSTKFANADYNIRFCKTIFSEALELQNQTIAGLMTSQILQKKAQHIQLITRIQKNFRLKLAKLQLKKKKESMHVCTLIFRRNLYSLIVNGTSRTFYIQNLDKLYPSAILPQANFYNLSFLHKLRAELLTNDDCLQQLQVIKKYFRLRSFAFKFIKKSQEVKLDTKFSTKFKKSLCFAKVMKHYLYRGKLIQGKMMYMLSVKNFQAFPRPYLLRVFTFDHRNLYRVDFQQLIYNSQKIFLQNHLDKINQIIDIQDRRCANILFQGPAKLNYKVKRTNSKSTLVSNFSFGSGEEFFKERRSRINSRVINPRDSSLLNRNKKNSINFKMRHKSALKQKDILLIKKWIEDSKEDSSISESQESSMA